MMPNNAECDNCHKDRCAFHSRADKLVSNEFPCDDCKSLIFDMAKAVKKQAYAEVFKELDDYSHYFPSMLLENLKKKFMR